MGELACLDDRQGVVWNGFDAPQSPHALRTGVP
jgi:hypothetical protein